MDQEAEKKKRTYSTLGSVGALVKYLIKGSLSFSTDPGDKY